MKNWLSSEFGRLTLASILALLAFPLLYLGSFGQNKGLLFSGLVIFVLAATIPLTAVFKTSKNKDESIETKM